MQTQSPLVLLDTPRTSRMCHGTFPEQWCLIPC